jgi:large subunit ribosomal protein L25
MVKENEKQSTLFAETRTVSGSTQSRRLRRSGVIPGVVNNEKCQSHLITMNSHDFEAFMHQHTSENIVVELTIDGKDTRKVLLREVQHDPITGSAVHAEFVEISMTRKMRVHIPIILRGEPVGVTQEGGILQQLIREVEVDCLPGDLVELIEADVSGLKLGKSIVVSDLKVSDKLAIVTEKHIAVAAVIAPREEDEVKAPEEAAAAATAEAVPTEPEVIGEKEREERRLEKEKGKDGASKEKGKEGAPKEKGKEGAPKEKGKHDGAPGEKAPDGGGRAGQPRK